MLWSFTKLSKWLQGSCQIEQINWSRNVTQSRNGSPRLRVILNACEHVPSILHWNLQILDNKKLYISLTHAHHQVKILPKLMQTESPLLASLANNHMNHMSLSREGACFIHIWVVLGFKQGWWFRSSTERTSFNFMFIILTRREGKRERQQLSLITCTGHQWGRVQGGCLQLI